MHFSSHWNVDQTRILTRRELGAVLAAPAKSQNAQRNRIIVRLACCCGLRVSEIGKLTVGDVLLEGARPHLRLQKGNTKGKKGRRVPLWWDAGTLADLKAWKEVRAEQGAKETEPFVCSVQSNRVGLGLQRAAIRRRFLSACKGLGKERVATLTIHHGRHTFISHALAGGRSLAEVRDAAGHANVAITSGYLHVAVDEDAAVGDLFACSQKGEER